MNYFTFTKKAADTVLVQAENGNWYLIPHWRITLKSANLDPEKVKDIKMDWDILKEYLELEVTKRNATEGKIHRVVGWLYDVLTTTVEPEMLEEETEMVKDLVEYARLKNDNNNGSES